MGYSAFEEAVLTPFQPEEDCSPVPERPRSWADCRKAERPCPFVTCRYHLITMFTRPFWRAHSDDQVVEFILSGMNGQSCALDMADRGESTLDEIAYQIGQTRENVRQMVDGGFYSDNRCRLSGWRVGTIHRGGAIRHARILCIIQGLEAKDLRDPVYIIIPANNRTTRRHYRAV